MATRTTTHITDEQEYKSAFSDSETRKQALEYAQDIRKFEIALYWRRATYFWTLIAAAFAGYFALSAATGPAPFLILMVSCLGLVLSAGWYLVNRGSKYWQENWERHVDALEDEFAGPLYKTTTSSELYPWIRVWGGYRYSVSKVNQLISLYVTLVWAGLVVSSALPFLAEVWGRWILVLTTVAFVVALLFLGRSGRQEERRSIDFRRSELGL